jgi:hypothetical protein
MHTFIVRVLVAEDVDELTGVVEEPLSGMRWPFHGGADLIDFLKRAIGRPSSREGGPDAEPAAGVSIEPRRS